MDDSFELQIDDIIANKVDVKKKKVDGKKKGNRVELELTKILTARFNKPFSRTVSSGARWFQAELSQNAREIFSGDLVVPEGFKFVIECKGGYDDIDMSSVFVKGNSELDKFLNQVTDDSVRCGRKPMLCWKKNRKPWLVFLLTEDMPDKIFEYILNYRQWSVVSLDKLLEIENSFFENQKS